MMRWALGAALLVAGGAIAVTILSPGADSSGDFRTQAATVCSKAQHDVEGLPGSPVGIDEALELEHNWLAIWKREISELQKLRGSNAANAAFDAGLADDKALANELESMLARPDFVELSLTLPHHPELAPPWLKEWLARTKALQADAQTQFARAGIPACEKSLG